MLVAPCIGVLVALDLMTLVATPMSSGPLSAIFVRFGLTALLVAHVLTLASIVRNDSTNLRHAALGLTLPIAAVVLVCAASGSSEVTETTVWPAITAMLVGFCLYGALEH
jgi:hypothetical protein